MDPLPFKNALEFLLGKIVHPDWDAEQWLRQEPDITARAFFLSNVENARFLDRAHKNLSAFMAEEIETVVNDAGEEVQALKVGGREDFVLRMRQFMVKEGMLNNDELDRIKDTSDDDVRELGSRARLKLVFDTNVRSAWGYGHWKQGMKPAVLRKYPAARFIRNRGAEDPRPRHVKHENDVRLKWDDAWWAKLQNGRDIGGFEVPWAPYGYHSYMEQEDVSRSEAEAQGLLKTGEAVPVSDNKGLNENLKASTKTLEPNVKKKLLDQLRRERELNKGHQSPEELATEAARKARLEAIERTLQKARERGDSAEVERVQKVLDEESYTQFAQLKVKDVGDSIILENSASEGYDEPIDHEEAAYISDPAGLGFTGEKIQRFLSQAVSGDSQTRPDLNEVKIRREREALRRAAREDESLLVEGIARSELDETGEHNIRISDDVRFWKYTKNGIYGYKPDVEAPNFHDLNDLRLTIQPASPQEYLRRVQLSNQLFGHSIDVEGITEHGDLVISQTAIAGSPATREQISEALLKGGWEQVSDSKTMLEGFMRSSSWVHKERGVVMVDARPANILTDETGKLYPIDVMLTDLDEFLEKALF